MVLNCPSLRTEARRKGKSSVGTAPGSTLDLGLIDYFDVSNFLLNIANITPDDDGGNTDLTDLTITGVSISGADADKFSILGFTPGTTVSKAGNLDLDIEFSPGGMLGVFDAVLTIETDEGTVLGGDGNDYVFNLTGEAVPEPASLALVAVGGLVLVSRRR